MVLLVCACQPVAEAQRVTEKGSTRGAAEPVAIADAARSEGAVVERSPLEPSPVEPKPAAPTPPSPPSPPSIDPALAAVVETVANPPQWNRIVDYPRRAVDMGAASLAQTDDGAIYAASGPVLMRLEPDGTSVPITLRGIEPMDEVPELLDGSYYHYGRTTLGGNGPAGGFMVVEYEIGTRGQSPPPQTYRMDQGRWRRVAGSGVFDSFPRGFGRWTDGSLLALRAFAPRYAHPAESEDERVPASEQRASATAIARAKQLVVVSGRPKAPALHWQGTAAAMTALPTGEVLVISGTEDAATALHYDATTNTSRVLPLPGALEPWGDNTHVKMRSADDAWLWGPYLAHFDGVKWARADSPCAANSAQLALTTTAEFLACRVPVDGTDRIAVLRRTAVDAGAWRTIGLPAMLAHSDVDGIAATADRVVVLLSEDGVPPSIWHTGPAPEQLHTFAPTPQLSAPILEAASDRPITDRCTQMFIPFTAAQGSDHSDAIERSGGEDLPGEATLATVRVRGTIVDGIVVGGLFGRQAATAAARISKALGSEVGEATCNVRPPQ